MKLRERMKLFQVSAAWPNISLDEFAEQMRQAAEGAETRSGVSIGPQSAMSISAFFCGVNIISGAIASCKYILYRRIDENSKERYRAHPLYGILHDYVNETLTAYQWKRTTMGHILLWGNGYSIVQRDPFRGTIYEVEGILHPADVKVSRIKGTRELIYQFKNDNGEVETLTRRGPRAIFHIPGPGFNGLTGFTLLTLARQSLGLTSAMEIYGQNFFGSGVHAGGFLERPETAPKLTPEARDRLIQSIVEQYAGIGKQGKFIVLEEGTKFNKNIIPPDDAQFLVSRTFQIQEIARWLNIAPHKLKELSRATFSNIEHQQIEDLQDCYQPWMELIEAETNMQLIEPDLRGKLFAEFMMDSLLRGDSVSRNSALAVQRQWGIINGDEWRARENMNPIPDGQGEKYILPSNYTIADKLGEKTEVPNFPPITPQPPEESEPAQPDEENEQ
jgi:HK97 family phage portal protein